MIRLSHYSVDMLTAAVGVAVLVCQGCTGRQSVVALPQSDSDSVAVSVPIEQLYLPDTAYESVRAVSFVIDEVDSVPRPLFDLDDRYTDTSSVLTFRKNLLRNADYGGRINGTPTDIEVAWRFDTAEDYTPTRFGQWGGGSGWTGQPLYKDGEVLVGSLCGKVYFIDFQTGKASHEPLDAHNVVKGTMSLDPELNNLYVGQGVPKDSSFGNMVFDLDRRLCTRLQESDPKAWRGWNAFDSSPIVAGGYLFWPGENCSLYKYERSQGQLRRVSTLRYRVKGMAPGIESSLCVYRNYGFFSDNRGNIICVNLNTMRPVWHYDNHDDSDATMVCRVEQETPFLYTGCEVDKQGDEGICHVVKLNALNGQLVWDRPVSCRRKQFPGKTLDGGMYASPLLGTGDCVNLVFVNICRNGAGKTSGELTAISTLDGTVRYTVSLSQWAWSSPIGFLNERGEMYVFTGDAGGRVYLVRGKTGEIVCQKSVAHNFESSPIAIGNAAVVGSRVNGVYKFVIK